LGQKSDNRKKLSVGQSAFFDMLIPFWGRQMLELVDIVACGFADFRPSNWREGREMENAGGSLGMQRNPDNEIGANIDRQACQAKVEFRRQRCEKHSRQEKFYISIRIACPTGCCSQNIGQAENFDRGTSCMRPLAQNLSHPL
jgi:hypothetical protein